MRLGRALAVLVAAISSTIAGAQTAAWKSLPPLPEPITNNAVAALEIDGKPFLFSFLGLGAGKRYSDISRAAWKLDINQGQWTRLPDVPGREGRLAATAQAVGGKIYLFGGFTVAANADEVSLADVDVFDPATNAWSQAAPMPVPVDDAVSGVWRGRYIYLVSGWSQKDNVANVQVFDPVSNVWAQASPIPGAAVFGHAGSLSGNTLVYCGGVKVDPTKKPRFVMSDECWRGDIDRRDPTAIDWTRIPAHPGPPRYRAAGGESPAGVAIIGGTDRPYNYNGIGYDGAPSEPLAGGWIYDARSNTWRAVPEYTPPTMDHRVSPGLTNRLIQVGGMEPGQHVTRAVRALPLD